MPDNRPRPPDLILIPITAPPHAAKKAAGDVGDPLTDTLTVAKLIDESRSIIPTPARMSEKGKTMIKCLKINEEIPDR